MSPEETPVSAEPPAAATAEETRNILLAAIAKHVAVAPNATTLLRLAEAYAWTVAPDQAHGGAERT